VLEKARFLLRKHHYPAGTIGEPLEHGLTLLSRLRSKTRVARPQKANHSAHNEP
jgi:hypothetical protein